MRTRNIRERIQQTLWFEIVGIAIFTPALALLAERSGETSLGIMIALSATAVGIMALYNHVFDLIEFRLTNRAASDRPQKLRLIHAALMEAIIALATVPIIKYGLQVDWFQALTADLALLAAYAVYGYLFHMAYDRLRPVRQHRALTH